MGSETVEALGRAAKGLTYMSESDEPFEVFEWKGDGRPIDARRLLELTSHPSDTTVETIGAEDFFGNLTTEQDWYGTEEKSMVRKYLKLKDVISRHLTDVSVFRVGRIRVDIYVVGVTPEGNWAGVKTVSVET